MVFYSILFWLIQNNTGQSLSPLATTDAIVLAKNVKKVEKKSYSLWQSLSKVNNFQTMSEIEKEDSQQSSRTNDLLPQLPNKWRIFTKVSNFFQFQLVLKNQAAVARDHVRLNFPKRPIFIIFY